LIASHKNMCSLVRRGTSFNGRYDRGGHLVNSSFRGDDHSCHRFPCILFPSKRKVIPGSKLFRAELGRAICIGFCTRGGAALGEDRPVF
jgi:hypothetical protein